MLVVAVVCLTAVLAAAGRTVSVRRPRPAYLLLVLSVAWLFANAALEGPVLWTLDPEHGLVLADLLTPAGVLLAAWRLWTVRRAEARSPGVTGRATGRLDHAEGVPAGTCLPPGH